MHRYNKNDTSNPSHRIYFSAWPHFFEERLFVSFQTIIIVYCTVYSLSGLTVPFVPLIRPVRRAAIRPTYTMIVSSISQSKEKMVQFNVAHHITIIKYISINGAQSPISATLLRNSLYRQAFTLYHQTCDMISSQ